MLLSLANLAAHVTCLAGLLQHMRLAEHTITAQPNTESRRTSAGHMRHPYPYAWLWLGYGALHANAWVWSAVFHTRDTWTTERLDYCSADAVVAFSTLAVLVRALGLRRCEGEGQRGGDSAGATQVRRCSVGL